MASFKLLPSLILSLSLSLSLLAASAQSPLPPPPPRSLINAADTLANSGFNAMSLTIQLIAPTLPLPSGAATTVTIFSPPDEAFVSSGQPSLAKLLLHFSPLSLSSASLLSLPFSSTIPSLLPSKHLVVTSNPPRNVSINNVGVSEIPIFDDGFVMVYAVDGFFSLDFALPSPNSTQSGNESDIQCLKLQSPSLFGDASGVLRSRGYSIMAAFLELQVLGFLDHGVPSKDSMKWTVFAPTDSDLVRFSGDFLGYSSLFMRHVAPCRIGWSDLEEMVNGTLVADNLHDFSLQITKDEDEETVMVNGAEITSPDMYESDWLVIHGIRGVIPLPDIPEVEEIDEVISIAPNHEET